MVESAFDGTVKEGFERRHTVINERVQELEDLLEHRTKMLKNCSDRNKRLREELSFYAQHDNWWTYPVPGGYASVISVDKGKRARQELKQYESK